MYFFFPKASLFCLSHDEMFESNLWYHYNHVARILVSLYHKLLYRLFLSLAKDGPFSFRMIKLPIRLKVLREYFLCYSPTVNCSQYFKTRSNTVASRQELIKVLLFFFLLRLYFDKRDPFDIYCAFLTFLEFNILT